MKSMLWILFSFFFLISGGCGSKKKSNNKTPKAIGGETPVSAPHPKGNNEEISVSSEEIHLKDLPKKVSIDFSVKENPTNEPTNEDNEEDLLLKELHEDLKENDQSVLIEGMQHEWLTDGIDVPVPKESNLSNKTLFLTLKTDLTTKKKYYQYGEHVYAHHEENNKHYIVVQSEENSNRIAFEVLSDVFGVIKLKFGKLEYAVENNPNPSKRLREGRFLQHVLLRVQCDCILTKENSLHSCRNNLGSKRLQQSKVLRKDAVQIKKINLYKFFKKFHLGTMAFEKKTLKQIIPVVPPVLKDPKAVDPAPLENR